jgi:nucleoside-diphosphate-sugar epimerase
MSESMRTLVIGGTGPTGPYVLRGLLERGHQVTLLHRGVHEPDGLPDVPHLHADPFFAESLADAIGEARFDLVLAMYGRVEAIAQVLADRCGHLVTIGGFAAYRGWQGTEPLGMRVYAPEDSPLADTDPNPPHFSLKVVTAEQRLFALASGGAYRASVLRYPQVYGPRSTVPWEWAIMKRARDGRTRMILPDNGLWIVSRCAVRNAAGSLLAIVDNLDAAAGNVYNCADDEQFTVGQWARLVAGLVGVELEFVGMPSELAPAALAEFTTAGARPHIAVDAGKIARELGYREVVSARDALAEVVGWLRRNPVTDAEYPNYPGWFDYELEDRLIDAYARAAAWVRDQAPSVRPELPHPLPHPKVSSLTVDHRGR